MAVVRSIFVIASCFFGLGSLDHPLVVPVAQESSVSWQEELAQINSELHELKDMKDRYDASVTFHEDQGMRWQFMQDQKQEARRSFQKAEEAKEASAMIQKRIDALNARKARILFEHPEVNGI